MRLLTFIVLMLALIAASVVAFGQDSTALWNEPLWVPSAQAGQTISSGNKELILFEVQKNKTYKLTEVAWSSTRYDSNNPIIVYSAGWTTNASGQAKFDGMFAYMNAPNGTQTASVTHTSAEPYRFELGSEHVAGHQEYNIYIDGVFKKKVTPSEGTQGSDKDLGTTSFVSETLTGTHKFEIRPTGQMVIDWIAISKMN